jgi:hypothetical protein
MRNLPLPLALLLVGSVRHYAWQIVPPHLAGMVSKGLGGAAILCLLALLWCRTSKSRLLAGVMMWWAWEETQVVVCSALYAWRPWTVEPGQAMCSALTGLNLDAIGVLAVALLAAQAGNFGSVKK